VDESMLKKVQAVAAIGAGLVALHGVSTRSWQRRHTMFVGLGLAASVGLFLLPMMKRDRAGIA
jgi:F0F1-type ATP synthase membrane subunit c/vacuolar-type H+-ATPase subunit K